METERCHEQEQVEVVGKAFVDHYYNLFDNDRSSLASLYQPTSMLTFEGQKIVGTGDISCKLNSLPFGNSKHTISTIDSQPSAYGGGIVVFVSGSLQLPGEEHQLRFSQMFHLIPTQDGSFFVQNDFFRLNYGACNTHGRQYSASRPLRAACTTSSSDGKYSSSISLDALSCHLPHAVAGGRTCSLEM